MLAFSSPKSLSEQVRILKEADNFEIEITDQTKIVGQEYISLCQSLVNQWLQGFNDDKLAIIVSQGLTYEPEDIIITDPYFASVLNADREVLVVDNVCRYIDGGVIETK